MHGGSASIFKHAVFGNHQKCAYNSGIRCKYYGVNQGILSYGRPDCHFLLDPGIHRARQRSQRHAVELKGSIEGVGIDQTVHIQDISNTGMATVGEAPLMCNDQFLNIHIEG